MWKEVLKSCEDSKQWEKAIALMEDVIKQYPESVDAYLYMEYLLMNLLVEENYDENEAKNYEKLSKKYFNESFAKFSSNPEYLFYTGKMAFMSEWYFGIEIEDARAMLFKAMELEPKNQLYQWTHYLYLNKIGRENRESLMEYASLVLKEGSPIQEQLRGKGSLGFYLLELIVGWAKDVTHRA